LITFGLYFALGHSQYLASWPPFVLPVVVPYALTIAIASAFGLWRLHFSCSFVTAILCAIIPIISLIFSVAFSCGFLKEKCLLI